MDSVENNSAKRKWLAYAGVGAFTFFLLKGLAWLALPLMLAWWGLR